MEEEFLNLSIENIKNDISYFILGFYEIAEKNGFVTSRVSSMNSVEMRKKRGEVGIQLYPMIAVGLKNGKITISYRTSASEITKQVFDINDAGSATAHIISLVTKT